MGKAINSTEHIVVVDDDTIHLRAAVNILVNAGMVVTALKSGKELMNYLNMGKRANLIMLDIMMPDMDGFCTYEKIREYEAENHEPETPVVFLTANDSKETETKGFELGALDYIRKPFEAEVLVKRIQNILMSTRRILTLSEEASTDQLTGLMNKTSVTRLLEKECLESRGSLLVLDLDSFKLINDIYGHEAGDKVLVSFAGLLKKTFRDQDILGRIGGDEFIAFMKGNDDREAVIRDAKRLNDKIFEEAKKIVGDDLSVSLGVSVGAVMVKGGADYSELFKKADQCLLTVKQNEKHGCSIWQNEDGLVSYSEGKSGDLKKINMILDERNVGGHAMWMGQDAFAVIYRYMLRFIHRYHEKAYKVLFTVVPEEGTMKESQFSVIMNNFGECVRDTLRNSDIMMQSSPNQFFLMLPMVSADNIQRVIDRILKIWEKTEYSRHVHITSETEPVDRSFSGERDRTALETPHILVVDDDETNRMIAENILKNSGMLVTSLRSGQELLNYVAEGNHADLILLDIIMPEMNGFDTIQKLRDMERSGENMPVIFLTASDDQESEKKGLMLGAMDFIKKPLVPEVLPIRIRHIIELIRLQRNLSKEVDRKASENEQLFIQVVKSLAEAIDAKDTYTNGHSDRVAKYAKEIARRYGYSDKDQNDIYMIGLLHDVGKIGIPVDVINKPARLTNEEFEVIKRHPVIGARILEKIRLMPKLATGAKWHHERFGGGGYPDGISGDSIPEEARIIAVADAYDAMTSNRSYREQMPQKEVREQIEKGKGTQFDPKFADIMLSIIDEDKNYDMREK